MSYSGRERRRPLPGDRRRSFSDLATEAIRARVRETRAEGAHWEHTANLSWVRWAVEDGAFAYCALRRNFDFLTGELGASPVPVELHDLPLIEKHAQAMPAGCRIRLGHLLEGHDRWWSSGGTEATLVWRLGWLALQLRYRLKPFLDSSAPPS